MKVSEWRSFLEQYSRAHVAEREQLVATLYLYERLTQALLWPSVIGGRPSVEQNFG